MKPLLTIPVLAGFLLAPAPPPSSAKVTVPGQDSIYTLAVKPADHPDDAVAFLLDEGIYRIEADGRVKNTTRMVVQILKPEGAKAYQEQRFSWNPERQRQTVNWMRIVKPSGEVVSEHPEQIQESDVPAAMGTPMYTATKVRRMSLSGLEPGTILDYSVTTESDPHMMPGEFAISWRVTPAVPVVKSNLVVDVPAALNPRIVEKNLDFKRRESVSNGRKVYTWAPAKVPRVKMERFAPDSLSPVMTVSVTPPIKWTTIGEWYAPIAREAYTITPSVEAKMSTVLAGAKSLDDSIRALHKWVAQDIRYVAIELGRGGYVPRSAETVVRTGYGDCKDKAMLFLGALRKIGVTGYPVLLNINGAERKESPAVAQFNHMIAAVRRGSDWIFTDLTAERYPLGELPRSEQGNLAVLVKEKDAEEIRLPESGLASVETVIAGTLAPDGNFAGTFEQTWTGYGATLTRGMFQEIDSTRRRLFARSMVSPYMPGAEADSFVSADSKKSDGPAVLRARIIRAKITTKAGEATFLNNPIHANTAWLRIADDLEQETARKLPYDASKIVSGMITRTVLRIKLPPGWAAVLPETKTLDGPVARYEVKYSQAGDELRIERTLSGLTEIIPVSRKKDVVDWLRKAGEDDNRLIVLKVPGGSLALR